MGLGGNWYGQLGNGSNTDSNVPVQVIDPNSPSGYLEGIIAISGGGAHSLAIYSPVYPPTNITLKREINKSLFREEAYHTITWSENPENKNVTISSYRIYRKL